MGIASVSASAVRIPTANNISQSTRRLAKRDYLVVAVRDDSSGMTGWGLSYIGTGGGRAATDCVDELLSRSLVGRDPRDIRGLWAEMYQESLVHGRRGILLRCIAAIDIALWDLCALTAGVPLAVLLGGKPGAVPAYASGGYYEAGDANPCDTVRTEIQLNQSRGFRDHKIKVGGIPPEEDARRIAAALEVIKNGGRLAVDANNAYKTSDEAISAIRIFEAVAQPFGLWWVEEPLSPEDVEGHSRIRDKVSTPVATGELHQTRWEFLELLRKNAASILQPDAGVVGGVSEWLTIARTAESYGVPLAPHWNANVHAHLVASSGNAFAVEHFLSEKGIYNAEELLVPESRLQYSEGCVLVSEKPGIGWEFDQTKLAHYSL